MKALCIIFGILFWLIIPTYAGHITKFTNSGTIFRIGESRSVQFIDKTQDVFGKPLKNMKYEWNFGDGNTSAEINPIHQYNSWDVFDIKLTVIDTVSKFVSDYIKRISIENFRDTCSTIVIDTTFIVDTIRIMVIDTIYVVSDNEIKIGKEYVAKIYDINGRFIDYMINYDPYNLPNGQFIILLYDGKKYQTKKLIKK